MVVIGLAPMTRMDPTPVYQRRVVGSIPIKAETTVVGAAEAHTLPQLTVLRG
jgi:hypothetical protein